MHSPPLILVVDDTPSDAMLVSKALAKSGYQTHVATDGVAAIAKTLELVPDLILLDMSLPGQDGLETCRKLKNDPVTSMIPVIFVTGHTDSKHILSAFEAGGSDYVSKPIRIAEINSRVSLQIRLREAERNLMERNEKLESLSALLAETNQHLACQSRTDSLTGRINRGAWEESARLEEDRSARHNHIYSILMLDVDSFKLLNDSQGHQTGDLCLQQIAQRVASNCRTIDLVGRYGGEEFVVLVPETPAQCAATLAERIRQSIWDLALPHAASVAGRVTVSIGVADSTAGPLVQVIRQADAALYRAKKCGRNLVCVADGSIPSSACTMHPGTDEHPSSEDTIVRDTPRVLIVEDNHTNRIVYKASLAKDGYQIVEAENGQEALTAVAQAQPDVIIMDIMMPVMDGLECTRRLKDDPATRHIPIIIVSARSDASEILAGLNAGADEYLTKPIRTTELMVRVRSMSRLSRERNDLLRSYHLRAEQIRVLSVLVDLCQAIGTAATIDEVLGHALAAVAEVALSRRVSIMIPDADRQFLTIARSIGLKPEIVVRAKVPVGSSIAGRVFSTREAIIINTDAEAAKFDRGEESDFFVSIPLMTAPLSNGGEALGVLNVTERLGGRPFEQREQEYIGLIANIVGSALQAMHHRVARDEARDMILIALAKLAEHRDNDTARHVDRVTLYACILAERLRRHERFCRQIDDQFMLDLRRAVPLHDIGKVAIPDGILRKPGRLSVEEMAIMRKHAEIGADTLQPIIEKVPDAHFLRIAEQVIRSHHEWYDGSGYPNQLAGDAIPLCARITALADVYDALTTDRAYKVAISHEAAESIITGSSGLQFDPDVVAAFIQSRDEFKRLAIELADSSHARLTPSSKPRELEMAISNR